MALPEPLPACPCRDPVFAALIGAQQEGYELCCPKVRPASLVSVTRLSVPPQLCPSHPLPLVHSPGPGRLLSLPPPRKTYILLVLFQTVVVMGWFSRAVLWLCPSPDWKHQWLPLPLAPSFGADLVCHSGTYSIPGLMQAPQIWLTPQWDLPHSSGNLSTNPAPTHPGRDLGGAGGQGFSGQRDGGGGGGCSLHCGPGRGPVT